MRGILAGVTGVSVGLGGFWVMCWLFHEIPIPEHADTWWSIPWVLTCVCICIGITVAGVLAAIAIDNDL
jgi:hypothetical protein